jgi:hypothetical protein
MIAPPFTLESPRLCALPGTPKKKPRQGRGFKSTHSYSNQRVYLRLI